MPALLTRISMGPSACSVLATNDAISFAFVTSATAARTSIPSFFNVAAAASSFFGSRAQMPIFAPKRAESSRDRESDSATRAGDQRYLSFERLFCVHGQTPMRRQKHLYSPSYHRGGDVKAGQAQFTITSCRWNSPCAFGMLFPIIPKILLRLCVSTGGAVLGCDTHLM